MQFVTIRLPVENIINTYITTQEDVLLKSIVHKYVQNAIILQLETLLVHIPTLPVHMTTKSVFSQYIA